MAPVMVVGIFIMEPFLRLWVGSSLAQQGADVGRIALLGFWANGVAYVPASLVEARGHARTVALVHLGEVVPYLAALFLLLQQFGIAGAALAFALRCAIDAAIFNRIALGAEAPWAPILLCAVVLLAAIAAASAFAAPGLAWVTALLLVTAAAVALFMRFAPAQFRVSPRAILARLGAVSA
jgi:hypothetical protein